jgi:hypothetical protein
MTGIRLSKEEAAQWIMEALEEQRETYECLKMDLEKAGRASNKFAIAVASLLRAEGLL